MVSPPLRASGPSGPFRAVALWLILLVCKCFVGGGWGMPFEWLATTCLSIKALSHHTQSTLSRFKVVFLGKRKADCAQRAAAQPRAFERVCALGREWSTRRSDSTAEVRVSQASRVRATKRTQQQRHSSPRPHRSSRAKPSRQRTLIPTIHHYY